MVYRSTVQNQGLKADTLSEEPELWDQESSLPSTCTVGMPYGSPVTQSFTVLPLSLLLQSHSPKEHHSSLSVAGFFYSLPLSHQNQDAFSL
ncbi:hypothetical protein PVL29_011061 [Vitis rotundifolia]|uniref:Uncharacterized protein n=1 Tax=Vitis rotundifolia TaxID=103349 RepID=A0AA39DVS4_VITRO|nr:hypothetical protein PVL29_011061 [Vitis rotundifolia]